LSSLITNYNKAMYTLEACHDLIDKYYKQGGEAIELTPGCLGLGTTICIGEGLKSCIIQEVYLNEWSSGHKIRFYNKMPSKYNKLLNKWYKNN